RHVIAPRRSPPWTGLGQRAAGVPQDRKARLWQQALQAPEDLENVLAVGKHVLREVDQRLHAGGDRPAPAPGQLPRYLQTRSAIDEPRDIKWPVGALDRERGREDAGR